MKRPRNAPGYAAVVAAGLAMTATLPAGTSLASAAGSRPGPTIRLIAAQRSVTVQRFGKQVFLDPGVYVTASGSALEFEVKRANYASPVTINQVIDVPGRGTVLRPLPSRALEGWSGLRSFLRMTIRNLHGKIVGSSVIPFCPDASNPQRTSPGSPANSRFPTACSANPFEKGMVWGLQRGWGADPFSSSIVVPLQPGRIGPDFNLRLGKYKVTVSITRLWRRLLAVPAGDATVTVKIKVVKGQGCVDVCPPVPPRRTSHRSALPALPSAPALSNPPAAALPDLVPLPSWGIGVQNHKATAKHPQSSDLTFGATVWIGGRSRLDVEGFRSPGSPVLKAYQYFWSDGKVIGRTRAGTMGFDGKKGHHHWHFEQFAQYRLLNSTKSVVLRSRKVGFCIAPTDAIDLVIPHAAWQPNETGFGGACGSPNALWVREMLPLGWGDTYVQTIAGQAFNISKLPNGTYYIEIIANPNRVLHESSYANDISIRKVILGGTPGHRTVRVPAVHGIDPER